MTHSETETARPNVYFNERYFAHTGKSLALRSWYRYCVNFTSWRQANFINISRYGLFNIITI